MGLQRRRGNISVGLILFLLAFGLVTQIRSSATPRVSLLDQPEADLAEILDKLQADSDRTRTEIENLRLREVQYRAMSSSEEDILNAARDNLKSLEVLSGIVSVDGPGVEITITDRNSYLTGFDLRQLTEELKSSGAAAVSVNGKRLLADSFFTRRAGRLILDGTTLKQPYVLKVVGESELLMQTLTLPRGVKDKLTTFKGVRVRVKKVPKLAVEAAQRR